jgi:predicted permease
MSGMRRVVGRGIGRANLAREVDEELAFHIEMRIQQLISAGRSPEAARQEALRQFGDMERVRTSCVTIDKERERSMQRLKLFHEMRRDVQFAARMLSRNAGATLVLIATLALGIGANTAIFTLVDALLLKKLPVPAPDELVAIGNPARTGSISFSTGTRTDLFSTETYRDLVTRNRQLSGVLASGRSDRLELKMDQSTAEPDRPRGRYVSGNYFRVLRVPAALGRTFDGSEDRAIGAAPVMVISDGYWLRHFNRDPRIVGRDVVLNGARLTIIGVTPTWFTGEIVGQRTDVFIPMMMQPVLSPHVSLVEDKDAYWLLLLGRRLPGVSYAQAAGEASTIVRQLVLDRMKNALDSASVRDVEVFVAPGARGLSRLRDTYGDALLTMMVGVALLLLIVCANVANLLLARGLSRSREIGVRLAIGAGRGRLVRQLLTESLLLGALSAAGGLLVARWGSRLLLTLAADGASAIPLDVGLDRVTLLYTVALSMGAVILFGLVPSLRASRVDLASLMRASAKSMSGSLGSRGGRAPLGSLLVSGQVALSLVLLIGAGLLVRSLRGIQNADTGLARDQLLVVDIDAVTRGYKGERLQVMALELQRRLKQIPGIAGVSFSENGIFSGSESAYNVQVPGYVGRTSEDSSANSDRIGPGYLNAIGARLLEGRDIEASDAGSSTRPVVVNESMVRHFFRGGSALGKTFRVDSNTMQIVGIVADVKDHQLTGEPTSRFYTSILQDTADAQVRSFVIRAVGDPAALIAPVRSAINGYDSSLRIESIESLAYRMRVSIREQRLLVRIASGFGTLALLLAAIGLYGVMTYAIARRTSEIGLRVALGAGRGTVLRMVLGDALRVVFLGVVIGLPLALASSRLLRAQLHGVAPTDVVAITLSLFVLTTSAVVAALLPALRASRVPPLVALRQE